MIINKSIFREYDIRGKYPDEINEQIAEAVSGAFAIDFKIKKIALAKDKRPQSDRIYEHVKAGLLKAGCEIFEMGQQSTPELYFAVGFKKLDGGLMVTASHNPNGYTGLKLVNKNGLAIGNKNGLVGVAERAQKILDKKIILKNSRKKIKQLDILSDYYKFVYSFIDCEKLKNLNTVLDVSGGSAAKIVEYFFIRMSGQNIKMNFRKDKFKDHGLNPMLPENYKNIEREVLKSKSDLGIIWDGDGDRVIFIDDKGKFIEPYYINCLLAEIFLSKIKKNKKIVIDGRMQLAIKKVITENQGQAIVSRSGYSNLVTEMQKQKILFGCENSGHYLFNLSLVYDGKNFICGDGIIPALMIIEYLSEKGLKISDAVEVFKKEFKISGEINLKNNNFAKSALKLKKQFKFDIDETDGISIGNDKWFFNARKSNTEPLIRINIEAKEKKKIIELKKQLINLTK